MTPADCTVFVVDPDPQSRHSIAVLASSLGLRSATFPAAEEFLGQLDPAQSGCAIVELCLPGMSGFELQECLATRGNPIPLIFLSASADVAAAVRVMRGGAVTLLEKPCRADDLVPAIHHAIHKDRLARAARAKHAEMRYRFDQLHDRERQTVQLVLDGLPNKTIARKLGVSRRTVERIRAAAFEKLGAESAIDVVRIVEAGVDHQAFTVG